MLNAWPERFAKARLCGWVRAIQTIKSILTTGKHCAMQDPYNRD